MKKIEVTITIKSSQCKYNPTTEFNNNKINIQFLNYVSIQKITNLLWRKNSL